MHIRRSGGPPSRRIGRSAYTDSCYEKTRRHHRRRRLHRIAPRGNAARSRLLGDRHRQPADRRHGEHRASRQPRFHLHQARRHQLHLHRGAGRLRAALGEPGEPDRLPRAADSDAQGRRARHAQGARPREGEGRALRDRLDLRGVRRSARASAEGNVLGQRESDRPARRVRRSQALRRGDDDGVSPLSRRGHEDRPHLQHVRPADAHQRRARRAGVHVAGAAQRGRHRVRRRHARRAASPTSPIWSTASSG